MFPAMALLPTRWQACTRSNYLQWGTVISGICPSLPQIMPLLPRFRPACLPLFLAALLAACGGGGDGGGNAGAGAGSTIDNNAGNAAIPLSTPEAGAPQATGVTATDGFNWTNFRRQQIGLATLARNTLINNAAQGHSDYQRVNNTITHVQTPGASGFTGVTMTDRLAAAGYALVVPYAYGEVISAGGSTSGFEAAENLVTAIYHRFIMLEPRYLEAGAGAATTPGGRTWFTLNLAATGGLGAGLGGGRFTVYPFDGQRGLPTIFLSDTETPDPVADRNAVGYPVSVHADITSSIVVQSFTITPRGGTPLPVRLLSAAVDANTPTSAAAIVPLQVLTTQATYDVEFRGTVDGIRAVRSWSFTTR